jgi:hypothetical protein
MDLNRTKGDGAMDKLTTTNVGISRRKFLISSACMAASLPAVTMVHRPSRKTFPNLPTKGKEEIP